MVPLRRGTIPVPTSPKTVPHFTHLGHDFHERLVPICHDGRGDCAVPALRNHQHYFSLVALCVSVACFEPASGLIRPVPAMRAWTHTQGVYSESSGQSGEDTLRHGTITRTAAFSSHLITNPDLARINAMSDLQSPPPELSPSESGHA
jgi:hypothetical protein